MSEMVLLGDEALGLAALHAGCSCAYGYPGTPSTEIIEYMQHVLEKEPEQLFPGSRQPLPIVRWCANEKTAFEAAVGASAMNRRTLVTMKHVGLNVAADPFMNSVLMNIRGGLVLAVADDPGMHSSQNEQDSRYFADFARMPCFEPRTQQEAYNMTRLAFDLSEEWHLPVMVKLVTRLSHSRAVVVPSSPRDRNAFSKFTDRDDFMVLPSTSRVKYKALLHHMVDIEGYSEDSNLNPLRIIEAGDKPFAVITTGLGANYFEENRGDLFFEPDHLHIGMYPLPVHKIRKLAEKARRVICIEEGYPYVERFLKGLLPQNLRVSGKLDGTLPSTGELDPDNVRAALGLEGLKSPVPPPDIPLPGRPPQLCQGCPHGDTFKALNAALEGFSESLVTSDIGCYTLGFLPPYESIETSLCMGASITMARGAAESGMHPAVAVLGDSTFLHSGLTGLLDLVSAEVPATVIILDNLTTAMTGGQDTLVASDRLRSIVLGLGVEENHCVKIIPLPKNHEQNSALIKQELEYRGVSVILAERECIQTLKRKNSVKQGGAA